MSAPNANDPVGNDEIVFRRIPISQKWYDPAVSDKPSPRAFHPTSNDSDGLSLSRESHVTSESLAREGIENARLRGKASPGFYVAAMRVSDLRAQGIEVVPDKAPDCPPGHALITDMTHVNRDSDQTKTWEVLLANATIRVDGPFRPDDPAS